MYILLCDCSVSSINIDGMLLKPNAVIITDLNDNDEPSFGEVCHLYMNENRKVLLELVGKCRVRQPFSFLESKKNCDI